MVMKKIISTILFIITIVIVLTASIEKVLAQSASKEKDVIEVLYFHGKQRCITCNAIEKLTKEVIESDFSEEVKGGKIRFKVIDISKKENEKISEKYEVSWSSLFINKWKGGKESVNNMTKFGFSKAKNSPKEFKEGVKNKIKELL